MDLKLWIKNNGIKPSFLAGKLDIHPVYLNAILNGRSSPSKKLIIKIEEFTKGEVTFIDWITHLKAQESQPQES